MENTFGQSNYHSSLGSYYKLMASKTDVDFTIIEQSEEKILHNIIRGIPQVYTESNNLIDLLLLTDYDINIKDENGKSGIHVTMEMKNIEILDTLIKNGADPNVIDNEHKTAFDSLCEYLAKSEFSIFETAAFRVLGHYIYKMIHAGCKVMPQDFNSFVENGSHLISDFNDTIECYNAELIKMDTVYLNGETTLRSILYKSENEMVQLVNNGNLENINIDIEYPYLGCLLKMQCRRGLVRKRLIESAKTAVKFTLNYYNNLSLNVPDPCYERIFEYLNNDELRIFISVVI